MSASPGALGGLRGLVHLRAILGNLGTHVLPATTSIPKARRRFARKSRQASRGRATRRRSGRAVAKGAGVRSVSARFAGAPLAAEGEKYVAVSRQCPGNFPRQGRSVFQATVLQAALAMTCCMCEKTIAAVSAALLTSHCEEVIVPYHLPSMVDSPPP